MLKIWENKIKKIVGRISVERNNNAAKSAALKHNTAEWDLPLELEDVLNLWILLMRNAGTIAWRAWKAAGSDVHHNHAGLNKRNALPLLA